MALTKEKKEQILKDLKDLVEKSKVIIFVNFHGLTSALTQELRGLVRGTGAKYVVVKKTLAKKVLKDFKFGGEIPNLEGEIALVFSALGGGDELASIRSLFEFSKNKKVLDLLGGVFENSFVDGGVISKLAQLPTREVLIWQFVNVINAPKQQTVGVLQAPIRDFINVLRQIK
ncbi:50S ribosomal protein L10 [Patescibacteria group bacterium]